MLFSSLEFVFLFLPVTVLITLLARLLGYNPFLIAVSACSLFLYGYYIPVYLLLLLGSAALNYVVAGYIFNGRRKWLYVLGVVGNLVILGYFKYADFFISTVNATLLTDWPPLHIALPLAISFITFEQIAFLSDVRSGKVARGSAIEYLAFITLFPKLIAGPIIRYTEILPQMQRPVHLLFERIFTGLCIFCFGLFNKVVIADSLTPVFEDIYAAAAEGPVPQADAVLATLAYATRIYFDFSAYSTMAVGLAWMFGIRLPINFLSPYRSTSIIEFWRRWHMTLSRFLRDYLYIPLGGSRHGELRRYLNLFLVMLLGGLWHGAAWAFVVWGFVHGIALAVNHAWRAFAPDLAKKTFGTPILGWAMTLAVVTGAWVFFGSQDLVTSGYIFQSLGNAAPPTITADQVLLVAGTWVIALAAPNAARIFGYRFLAGEHRWDNLPPIPVPSLATAFVAALALVISLIFIVSGPPNAFIYFQF